MADVGDCTTSEPGLWVCVIVLQFPHYLVDIANLQRLCFHQIRPPRPMVCVSSQPNQNISPTQEAQMLKVAEWIISDSAVDAWRKAHEELKQRHPAWAVAILNERKFRGLQKK